MDVSVESKKTSIEDLSKEELVKKCKGLLTLAQKAKQAKDALQEENNELKRNLREDSATTEIIEALTQQTLNHVTTIEQLKSQNQDLLNKLQDYEVRNNTLDNENISFKRQTTRLQDENEQLLTHLDSLEKQIEEFKRLGLQQQNELLLLEKHNKQIEEASEMKIVELQNMLAISLEEVKKLKCENDTAMEKMSDLKLNLAEKDRNILTIHEELNKTSVEGDVAKLNSVIASKNHELDELKAMLRTITEVSFEDLHSTIDKLREKLKSYHSKIVKFALNVKGVKEEKNLLLATFKTYTNQVEEWKGQLVVTSQKLLDHLNRIREENDDLHKENKQLKESIEAHKTDDEKSKELEEIEAMKIKNSQLASEINTLLLIEEDYKKQIEELLADKQYISEAMVNATERHEEEMKNFGDQTKRDTMENERICIEYRKIISKLEEDVSLNLREIEELRQKNFTLQEQVEHSKLTEKQFADQTSEEILKLVQENTELRKKVEEKEMETCKVEEQDPDVNEDVVTSLKRENAEVLAEMNEMNQALKERGETISKLQAHCDEIMKKLQIYETQANKNVDNITQKEEIIRNLKEELDKVKGTEEPLSEVEELKAQVAQLKNDLKHQNDNSYAESENMSTSTVSRTEELNKFKDLEGSWEERYGKLRNLALKLKRKIKELTEELAKEQNEKNDAQTKCANSIKTVTTLQSQCDKLQDELEASRQETKEYIVKLDQVAIDVSKDKQKLAENDDLISALKRETDELKSEKVNTEAWKKQIGNKVQTLRKEVEANKVLKKEFEMKIAKLTSELEQKEKALKTESDCHQQTRSSLEHSNNERKKNSVLNLEMQDYERSVKELSQKLEKKQELITKLKNQVDSQKSTQSAVREQNKLLEGEAEELRTELESNRNEILALKKQINEFEELVSSKEDKIKDLTQLLETSRSENEEFSTELSKVIAEHQKSTQHLRNEKEHFRSQNLGLQQSLREVQNTLKLKEDELETIKTDYDSYKVRAQSVLRQNQSRDVGLEEKLGEEVSGLKIKCETLISELNEAKGEIEKLKKQSSELTSEKEELAAKCQEAVSEVEDLKHLYDQLSAKHQQMVIEHGETVRSLKVHAETLAQCYRQQIAEQEVRHNREVIELQSKIEQAPSPSEPFPSLPSMPREEGEGSESTESVGRSNSVHPVPLERLLGGDNDQEVTYLKKQLTEEESRTNHLTALLSDTEQDLAKHVQMNKLLKEEIRRQQRALEREKHAENLEYLKNVVFKFVTLHSGDERSRLVPVLNTILKLSPEETEKLNLVARGEPGIKAWASYLPTWSTTTKP